MCHQHSFCLKGSFCLCVLLVCTPARKKPAGTAVGRRHGRLHLTRTVRLQNSFLLNTGRLFHWVGHPLPCFEDKKTSLLGWDRAAPGLQPARIAVQRGTRPVKSTFGDCSRSFPQPCPPPGGMQEWAPASEELCELKAIFQVKSARAAVAAPGLYLSLK